VSGQLSYRSCINEPAQRAVELVPVWHDPKTVVDLKQQAREGQRSHDRSIGDDLLDQGLELMVLSI
jgi:hypothetical protein